jgi:hypothetical protein
VETNSTHSSGDPLGCKTVRCHEINGTS